MVFFTCYLNGCYWYHIVVPVAGVQRYHYCRLTLVIAVGLLTPSNTLYHYLVASSTMHEYAPVVQ
jgi:hypothetical protein